jgi:hypothetical protein
MKKEVATAPPAPAAVEPPPATAAEAETSNGSA